MASKCGEINGAWFVLAAAVFWGTTGTSQALAPSTAQPAAIGALRIAFGGVCLLVWAYSRRSFAPTWRWPFNALLAAAVAMAAYQLCFFAGVARTGVTVGTIIGIGSSPILAGLIGFFVRGELPSKRWVWATLLAILGSGMLVLSGGEVRVDLLGVLLAVVAGGAYATFTVASKNLLDNHPPEAVMAVSFCLGALLLSPVLLFNDLSWLAQPAGWLVIGHLGLVTVALAYTLFGYGLQRVRIATAATLTLAEPLTAAMLGVFLLGERLNLPAWLGVGMVFAGLAILSIADKKSGSN